MSTFFSELHATVHRSRKTPEEIADDIGISYSMLCRMVLDGDSGATFDLRRYIPLLRATKNYRTLKYLANHFGFLLVKAPRGRKSKTGNGALMNDFQKTAAEIVRLFLNFTERPDEAGKRETIAAIVDHMEQGAGLKVRVERYRQGDLFQDE
jgi:hypothetical protein